MSAILPPSDCTMNLLGAHSPQGEENFLTTLLSHFLAFWKSCISLVKNGENHSSAVLESLVTQADFLVQELITSPEKRRVFETSLTDLFLNLQMTKQKHHLQQQRNSQLESNSTTLNPVKASTPQQTLKQVLQSLVSSTTCYSVPFIHSTLKDTLTFSSNASPATANGLAYPPLNSPPYLSPGLFHTAPTHSYNSNKVSASHASPLEACVAETASERYVGKKKNLEDEWDPTDEYHHDDDPGYRVMDLWESDYPLESLCVNVSHPLNKNDLMDSPFIEIRSCVPTPLPTIPFSPSLEASLPSCKQESSVRLPSPTFGASSASPPTSVIVGEAPDAPTDAPAADIYKDTVLPDDELATARHSSPFLLFSSPSTNSNNLSSSQILPSVYHQADTDYEPIKTKWEEEFENGDFNAFLKKKRSVKRLRHTLVHAAERFPTSSDPHFPLRVPDENGGETVLDVFNLRVIFERYKTALQEQKDLFLPCFSVVAGRYQVEFELGEGVSSRALQCKDLLTGQRVCMKVIKNHKEYLDQSLDEVMLLRFLNANGDPDALNFLKLYDFFYHRDHLILITELLQENLYEVSKYCRTKNLSSYFSIGRLQKITHQVLVTLRFIHSLRLIHCDLKPENILMQNPMDCSVKIIDFGSSCFDDDAQSTYIQSRPYRAPECLLGLPYDERIDMWSLGCILAELWTGYVLFHSGSVQGLIARIVGITGRIPEDMVAHGQSTSNLFSSHGHLYQVLLQDQCPRRGKHYRLLWPKKSSLYQRMRTNDSLFLDFLSSLLQIDPTKRATAEKSLSHPWLTPGLYLDGL